jgi:hypothetical protein
VTGSFENFGSTAVGEGARSTQAISMRHGAAFWLRFFFANLFDGLKGSYG